MQVGGDRRFLSISMTAADFIELLMKKTFIEGAPGDAPQSLDEKGFLNAEKLSKGLRLFNIEMDASGSVVTIDLDSDDLPTRGFEYSGRMIRRPAHVAVAIEK